MPDKDYSHRAVTDKLGLKPGHTVRVVGLPAQSDHALLPQVVAKIEQPLAPVGMADVILYWPQTATEITPTLAELRTQLVPNGGIWVITAKKQATSGSGMPYFKQDDLIPLGLAAGLVDNKICALSDQESAMRFVIRKQDRPVK